MPAPDPMRGDPPHPAPPRLRSPLDPTSGDPLHPAPPRLRSPLDPTSGDPLHPAPPRLRSPLDPTSGDPLHPAPPRLRSPLVLLDGASMWFRSFFGVPSSITAPDGRPVNAVRGFIDSMAW
ncbi:hypothetical protein TMJG_00350 [Mycobacterium tuberculosis SUMu010]|nr:hypothetical protein TMJG_00350 [Mycobacterium tuberculosis SUMu010]